MRTIQGTLMHLMMNIQRKVMLRVFLALSLYFTMVKLYTVMELMYFISTPTIPPWLPLKGNDHSQIVIEALLLNTDKTEIPAIFPALVDLFLIMKTPVWSSNCNSTTVSFLQLQATSSTGKNVTLCLILTFWSFFQQYLKRNHQDFFTDSTLLFF